MKTKLPLLIFLFVGVACKKDKLCDEPELPCQTHDGKNTFGCFIDGVPFIADVRFTIGGATAVSGQFDESSKLLQIQGTREDSEENLDKVSFQAYVISEASNYTMNVLIAEYVGYRDYSGQVCDYYHDLNKKGSVNITFLDTEKNIIAGTFEMTLINPDCAENQTMIITKGRFDFGY
jgi:hypothetical protein